jgi:hypothetical protein
MDGSIVSNDRRAIRAVPYSGKSRETDMATIQIELPDEVLLSLKETPASFPKVIRMAAAAKL